jgi:imidazolonepropionase-like amidohydrolase
MKFLLSLTLFLTFTISHTSFAQTTETFSVFKLRRKIGNEVALTSIKAADTTTQVNIITNDRGSELKLQAGLSFHSKGIRYWSAGNTSRFKNDKIDTLATFNNRFPITNNGSIKIKELLVNWWVKRGRLANIPPVWEREDLHIKQLGKEKDPLINDSLLVLELRNVAPNNEIIWLNTQGKAVFLATCDTEGDKREVISDRYLAAFDVLTKKSDSYLIDTYASRNKNLGKVYSNVAVTGGNIIDVLNNGQIITNTLVLLKDGLITHVGSMDATLIPKGAHIIDARNQYLLPGLWNMHVHLFHPDYLKQELLSGVTTVRDMANEFDMINSLQQRINNDQLPAPTIMKAGVLDGRSATTLGIVEGNDVTEIRRNIKSYYDAGFNQIKVYSNIKKSSLNTIVKEAQAYQMDVVGHIPFGITLKTAVESGITGISHIHYFMNALKWNGTQFNADNQALLTLLQQRHVVVDPTLSVYTLFQDKKLPLYNRIISFIHNGGIPIVAGTDNEGTIACELAAYVKAGLTPIDAIKTATIIPATVMKAESLSGSITTGKRSDIILLGSNPLLNINAVEDLKVVVKGTLVVDLRKTN